MLQVEPALRSDLVKQISDLLKERRLIGNGYNSRSPGSLFIDADSIGFEPRLRFGGDQIRQYTERTLLNSLRDCGLYKRAERFQNHTPIDIGIINALGGTSLDTFWSTMEQELELLDFPMRLVGEEQVRSASRADLEKSVETLRKGNPDIMLAFFPDASDEDEDDWGAYHHLKSLTVGTGMPSQVVYRSTLGKHFAMANIVLGILGKTGNTPFILAEPLPYADLVVGIDIARERKRRLAGSINATAMARIYFGNGEFLRYVIHDAPLEGETIPENTLQALFPSGEFQGKKVVVHRDGYFRGDEKSVLKTWAQRIGAEFHLVEVIKSGTPRLYASLAGTIQQPPKASAFKLSDTEAFLVSSLPPFADATPQPLRIRTDASLTVEHALHSVLSLTLLLYGSLRPPRLPVDIHYADRIAYLLLRGIKPRELEGSNPYWL